MHQLPTSPHTGVAAAPAVAGHSRVVRVVAFLAYALAGLVLSSAAHAADLPVRLLLPMHWVVLVGGLAFGWRAGLLLGVMSPALALLFSGLPAVVRVAPMAVELGLYGLVAGLGHQRRHLWRYVAVALIAGRLGWLAMSLALVDAPTVAILVALAGGLGPGLFAAAAQLALVPPLARRLEKATRSHRDLQAPPARPE